MARRRSFAGVFMPVFDEICDGTKRDCRWNDTNETETRPGVTGSRVGCVGPRWKVERCGPGAGPEPDSASNYAPR